MTRKVKSTIAEIQLAKKGRLKENLQKNMIHERNMLAYSTMAYSKEI